MKLYLDYKKQFNILISLGILFLLPMVFIFAQTAEDVRNNINQKSADIVKLEEQIKIYQNELNSLNKQKDSLSVSIKQLDITKKKLNADISVTQKKVDKINLQIQNLSSDIGSKENSIINNIDSIKLEIRKINELENTSLLSTILSDSNFTLIWNDINNIATVRESIRNNIKRLTRTKIVLEDTRSETIEAKNELTRLRQQLSDQRKIVIQNTNAKNKLLKETRNSEANYQKLVKERLVKQAAFEKELSAFEAQLQFILDPSKIPDDRVFSWPLGKIHITSPYAPRWGGFHRGTDFRASVGTPVKAMADGVVIGTGNTDVCCPKASFGKWILIEYNNGLSSTFAHLSFRSVKKGQKVSRGTVVGYSGNSGSSTGPHLHVSIYVSSGVKIDSFKSKSYPGRTLIQPIAAKAAYLNPMDFLPKL